MGYIKGDAVIKSVSLKKGVFGGIKELKLEGITSQISANNWFSGTKGKFILVLSANPAKDICKSVNGKAENLKGKSMEIKFKSD